MKRNNQRIANIILVFCFLVNIAQSNPNIATYQNNNAGSPEMVPVTDGFSSLKKKLDGGYIIIESNTLEFIYVEEYAVSGGQNLDFEIYDYTMDESSYNEASLSLPYVQYGENRFSLNLSPLSLSSGTFYILEVTDQKGGKQYLKFKTP